MAGINRDGRRFNVLNFLTPNMLNPELSIRIPPIIDISASKSVVKKFASNPAVT